MGCRRDRRVMSATQSEPMAADFPNLLRGQRRDNEPLSKYTSWRVGGPAQHLYVPADVADLVNFMRSLPAGEAICFLGLGSNVLAPDSGVPGTVVLLHAALNEMHLVQRDSTGGTIYVQAGVAAPKVARFAAVAGLDGAEFLAGIPGTVGGALCMNAGCYGAETWDFVVDVLTIDRSGDLHTRLPREFEVSYRSVRSVAPQAPTAVPKQEGSSSAVPKEESSAGAGAREEWFVAARLRFPTGDVEASQHKIKLLLNRRIATQPLSEPNAGSVFRNPPGDHAARLIESCGLKGLQQGGARVSLKHANFIVNRGGATAADIEALIVTIQETVLRETGVALLREVRILQVPARRHE
jgi:UDP-N-acetylmuramate dehydrogenase